MQVCGRLLRETCLWGSIMNHHGIKKGGLEQLAQTLKQVQVDDQSTHPSIHQSFIASGRCIEPDAPACETVVKVNVVANPSAQGVTHTHTPTPTLFTI